MTPRRLDWQVVRPKLRQIDRLVGAIDADLAVPLRPSAGMRMVPVHAYLDVEFTSATHRVPLLHGRRAR